MRQVPSPEVEWMHRQWKSVLLMVGAVALIGGLFFAFWIFDPVNYPASQAARLRHTVALTPFADPKDRAAFEKDLLQYQTDNQIKIWTTVVQAIGAAVLAVGGYFAFRNLQVAQRNLQATQAKLDVDREGQVTNRFTQAIGQLGAELKDGKPNVEVRLGGIYTLERIAKDSPKDHWTIMETLTAYVRENTPWPRRPVGQRRVGQRRELSRLRIGPLLHPSGLPIGASSLPALRSDIQAVLTVIGRREVRHDAPEGRLNLEHCNLTNADLFGANLSKVRLTGTNVSVHGGAPG